MFLKNSIIFIFLFIFSCQPVELIEPVKIENSLLENIQVNAKNINLNTSYNPIFSEENIEDQIKVSPLAIITSWNNENITAFGYENKFEITILEAAITKKEINNNDAKKYEEKTLFKYEVFFLVEYKLYDDSDILIANVSVESKRTTTSQKYISLNETDLIITDLINKTLIDFTKEAKILIKDYMGNYIK